MIRHLSSLLLAAAAALAAIPTGPDPGAMAPAFEAPDQNGTSQTLKSLTGKKGLVLVFFRSADW